MTNSGSPLTEFIAQTREQAEKGLGNWELKEPIRMELSTIVTENAGGGVNIQVINAGTKYEQQQIQKIQITIGPKSALQEAETQIKVSEAEAIAKLLKQRPEIALTRYTPHQ